MPEPTTVPYIFLRKTSFLIFSISNGLRISSYISSKKDLTEAKELNGRLYTPKATFPLENTSPEDILEYSNILENIFINAAIRNSKGFTITSFFQDNKKFILSLEKFSPLDKISNISMHQFFIKELCRQITTLIIAGVEVGINFREVFLIKPGETPPENFRPGIDECVTDTEEYKAKINKFSYQLGKAILNNSAFGFEDDKNITIDKEIPAQIFARRKGIKKAYDIYYDLTIPMKNLEAFNSPIEELIAVKGDAFTNKHNHKILTFGPAVSILDLKLNILEKNHLNNELIIVLSSEKYKDEAERQKVFNDTFALIKEINCRIPLHIILLTNPKTDKNLIELSPNISENKDETFRLLAEDSGYYLSSQKIFSAIHSNYQEHFLNGMATFLSPDETIEAKPTPITNVVASAYIYSSTKDPDLRKSKSLNIIDLKAKVSLSITEQQELTENEDLSQNLNQTTELTANIVEQNQQNLTDSYSYWDQTYGLYAFSKYLKKQAEKKLIDISEREQLLENNYVFTDYYCTNYSNKIFLEEIINNEEFRLKIAAKYFGRAYLYKGNIIKLPKYSIDNTYDYLFDDLLNHVNLHNDGLNPDNCNIVQTFLSERTLSSLKNLHQVDFYRDSPGYIPLNSILLSNLNSTQTRENHGYRDHKDYYVLLNEENLKPILEDRKLQLIKKANHY